MIAVVRWEVLDPVAWWRDHEGTVCPDVSALVATTAEVVAGPGADGTFQVDVVYVDPATIARRRLPLTGYDRRIR